MLQIFHKYQFKENNKKLLALLIFATPTTVAQAADSTEIYKWYNSDGTVVYGNVNVPKTAERIVTDNVIIKTVPTTPVPHGSELMYQEDRGRQLSGPARLIELERLDKLRAQCIEDRRTDCNDDDALITQGAKRDVRSIEIQER